MPALKHLHTYQRIKDKPNLMRCIHPDCSHYERKELLVGKRAACICGNEYYLEPKILRLKTPHCPNCTKSSSNNNQAAETLINLLDLMPELIRPASKSHHLNIEKEPNKFEGDLGGEL